MASRPPKPLEEINDDLGGRVMKVENCEVSPDSFAKFIKKKAYWTPEAVTTAILVLARRYPLSKIEETFKRENLSEVNFDPWHGGL